MLKIKKYLRPIRTYFFQPFFDIFNLTFAYLYFKIYNTTPQSGLQSLVNLFCLTRGQINDVLSKVIAIRNPKISIKEKTGVLGSIDSLAKDKVNDILQSDGFYVFNNRLDTNTLNELVSFAHTTPATVRGISDQKFIYCANDLKGVRYDFDPQDLLKLSSVQNLISDPSFLKVAQDYLNAQPILDLVTMWWHTPFQKHPDGEAAQLFHFDMDRIKWIKFFIYLTDVDIDNGPHTFLPKTHLSFGIPKSLLKKGYARITDEEAEIALKEKYIPKQFLGEKGTIIAEDTRGLHKGGVVYGKSRLVLQFQYTNHLFGANISKYNLKIFSEKLEKMASMYPRSYSSFSFEKNIKA